MTKARLEEVIIVESNRGLGQDESDPIRKVISIFRKDGTLIAEVDPIRNEVGKYCIDDFAQTIPFPEQ
jgi:hypothetical protein